jgi:hypothetical protein
MSTILPRDDEHKSIPAMRLAESGAHSINAGASSARNASAFNESTRVISLYATGPVYVRFGGSTVTASDSDHYFPGGVYYDMAIGGGKTAHYTHIAAVRADTDCFLYISEKE